MTDIFATLRKTQIASREVAALRRLAKNRRLASMKSTRRRSAISPSALDGGRVTAPPALANPSTQEK
jgi:hypothetical protein